MYKVVKVGYFGGDFSGCILEHSDSEGNITCSWYDDMLVKATLKSGKAIEGCHLDASDNIVFDDSFERYDLTFEEHIKHTVELANCLEEKRKQELVETLKESFNNDEDLLQRYNILKGKYEELKENYNSLLKTINQG